MYLATDIEGRGLQVKIYLFAAFLRHLSLSNVASTSVAKLSFGGIQAAKLEDRLKIISQYDLRPTTSSH
jgi:hypothetical protein